MTVDWGIVLGLGGIALTILIVGGGAIVSLVVFGNKLLELLGRLDRKTDELAPMAKDVVAVRQTVQNLFQITSTFFALGQSGTVTIELQNLGRTTVSAEPGPNDTKYDIRTTSRFISGELIGRLTRDTGFEEIEIEAFGGRISHMVVGRDTLILTLPSTDARICADFLSRFLGWLDSTHFEERQKLLDAFEKPIAPSIQQPES